MNDKKKYSSSAIVAAIMVVGGVIAIALMFALTSKDKAPRASAIASDTSAVPMQMDYAVPELELTTLEGAPVSLKDFRGSVVLVNLWATWCPPCRQEMPALNTFYERYKDQGFTLIAIDQEETREVVQPFVEELGLTFPIWLDKDYLAEQEFKTVNLPSSYVVDRRGRVRLLWIGAISKTNLEKYVSPIILE